MTSRGFSLASIANSARHQFWLREAQRGEVFDITNALNANLPRALHRTCTLQIALSSARNARSATQRTQGVGKTSMHSPGPARRIRLGWMGGGVGGREGRGGIETACDADTWRVDETCRRNKAARSCCPALSCPVVRHSSPPISSTNAQKIIVIDLMVSQLSSNAASFP